MMLRGFHAVPSPTPLLCFMSVYHLLVLSLPISSLEASLVPAQFVAVTLTVYMELRAANASELTTEKDTLLAG